MNDLQNIYRMLQNLDDGQVHIIKRMDGLERQQEAGREDREQMKRMLAKLDDPDIGRVARAETRIVTLERTVKVFDVLRQRGVGIVIGGAVVVLIVGQGLGAAVKKVSSWFLQ